MSQPPAPERIPLRDVLRAIFWPPLDTREPVDTPAETDAPDAAPTPPSAQEVIPPEVLARLEPASVAYPGSALDDAPPLSPSRTTALVGGTLITLAIGFVAQTVLSAGQQPGAGAVLYALALAAWGGVLAAAYWPPLSALLTRGPQVSGSAGAPLAAGWALQPFGQRGLLAVAALGFSALTYVLTADNTFTIPAVLAWLVSVVLWLIVAAERDLSALLLDWGDALSDLPGRLRALPRPPLWQTAALVAILAVGAFFRFYRLDAIPLEMTSDHVEKVLDAYHVSQGVTPVFFRNNGGREAIQFYLLAGAAKLFGTGFSFLTLKLVAAIEGLLLLPLLVLLGREVVDRETGLLAAALVAVSWWHVVLSRLALRIPLTPLVFTLILITLIRGIRTGSRRAWLWAGVWMGVGVYSYQAMRITPLVALAAALFAVGGPAVQMLAARGRAAEAWQAVTGNTLARQVANLTLAGLVALAIFVPMLRVWHDYPQDLWNRVVNRTTESEVTIEDTAVSVFADNYRDALGMFNVRGDIAWISAIPGKPFLDRVAGVLFVLGVATWLVRLTLRRDPADGFLLAALLIMLLPSALAIAFPIENPSTTRASGAIPIAALLAAWPLGLLRQRWRGALRPGWGAALAALLLAGSAWYGYRAVFVEYDASYRAASLNPSEVAAAVREVVGPDAPLDSVWLQGWPYWHDYRAIGIEAGEPEFRNAILDVAALRSLVLTPDTFGPRPLVFIVHPDDSEALAILAETFPEGIAQPHASAENPGRPFVLFVVPEG